jgi:hypothetical protein
VSATLVIPARNGAAFLPACLSSLLAQAGASFDVIVVDNGSTDGSADLVARDFPQVRLIRAEQALGFAGACNVGIRAALASPAPPETVVVLNQDTLLDVGWLAALLAPLAEHPRVGIVGSLARFPDGRIQHAGGELLPLGYGRNIGYGQLEPPLLQITEADYVAGVATALRVEMLEQIGLFDEGFNPAYFEDVDLCLRAQAAAWELAIAYDATLVHHEGAASSVASYAHAALIERNRLRLLLKHWPVARLLGEWRELELAELLQRARQGASQLVRRAYLRALTDLPTLAAERGLSLDERQALAALLAELRSRAIAVERTSRLGGLSLPAEQPLDSTFASNGHLQAPAPQPQRPPFTLGEKPPVSIVMLTWNGLDVTQNCLASIRERTTGVDYQLVVVDNGSTDGTLEWLRAQPDVRLIANSSNAGFTRGNNQGLAIVPPEHDVLLLNNDTIILQEYWLAHLRDVANAHPDYGVVGCTLLRADGTLQHAGTYMPVSNFWGYQIGGGEPFVGQYPGVREVEGVVGAAMYIRRDCRAAVGGLDEHYFSYFEDTDYCLRAREAGFKVVCTGGTQIMHLENTSAKLNKVNWWQMFGAAQQIFLSKWQRYYDTQRYSRALFWHALHATPTGYATSSREFVLELDRQGVDVRLACIFGTDYTEPLTGDPRVDQLRKRPKDSSLVQVVYSQGDAFTKNSGRYRVGFTMLEADGLPYDWVVQANQMHEVWVPSRFNQEVFAEAGVRVPLYRVPLGVDTNYFHPQIARQRPSQRFVFLSIFEWIERKAPEVLLRAYADEFSAADDTLLLLKIFDHHLSYDVPKQIARLMAGSTARVALLLNQHIAPQQMGCLYRSADCFVLPTRGEGWGMPILEAMACGLPVIATDWGAQRDFFKAELGYPLRSTGLVPAISRSPYYAGLRWANPDLEHLRYLLRYVYEHQDEARERGQRAATTVAERWTWAHATDKIMGRLEEIEGVKG